METICVFWLEGDDTMRGIDKGISEGESREENDESDQSLWLFYYQLDSATQEREGTHLELGSNRKQLSTVINEKGRNYSDEERSRMKDN